MAKRRVILRETASFVCYRLDGSIPKHRYYLAAKDKNVQPKSKRIRRGDIGYLTSEIKEDRTFDAAAIWDYGVGVFQR